MHKRELIFKIVVVVLAISFAGAAFLSYAIFGALLQVRALSAAWGVLSILSGAPFIIVPFDRGRTLRAMVYHLPQPALLVVLTVTISNLLLMVLSPLLLWLPAPGYWYDVSPVLLIALIGMVIFRSASRVVEKRITLPFAQLPAGWKGLTILHLSDIHAGPFMGPERLERIVKRINQAKFDVCVLTGDIVNHASDDLDWALPILEKIKAPMGTFAVLGNHEYIDDEEKIKALYKKSSIQLLHESSVLVSDGTHNVRLVGVDYPFAPMALDATSIKKALDESLHYLPEVDGEFRVLLSHHPEGFRTGRKMGFPLTLAGHTHGGQVIVFKKNIISPFVHYKRGLYRKGENFLFVNSGLGNWLPFRVNCPCEYVLVRVVRKESLDKPLENVR